MADQYAAVNAAAQRSAGLPTRRGSWRLASALLLLGATAIASAAPANRLSGAAPVSRQATDGQHDFDWEFGTWKTHLKRLKHPLSGSTEWVDYDGTTKVTPVWGGKANLVQLDVTGAGGCIEALSLRLYNPDTRQWTLNFSNSATGTLSLPPSTGTFTGSRGEFYDREAFGARTILVRFIISRETPDRVSFEQAYSADGGAHWETNWLATDTRTPPGSRRNSGAGLD